MTYLAREVLLERLERRTEPLLTACAFLMVPLLVGPLAWDLTAREARIYLFLDVAIWAVFALDLATKTAISTNRVAYLRQHWVDVVLVAVPFFRPLRVLRLAVYGFRAVGGIRRMLAADWLILYALGLLIIGATAVTTAEMGATGATIRSFPDALWWAVVTMTTVGYGDVSPVTPAGRVIAGGLMLAGIAIFGALTANLASWLVRTDQADVQAELLAEVAELLTGLRTDLARLNAD